MPELASLEGAKLIVGADATGRQAARRSGRGRRAHVVDDYLGARVRRVPDVVDRADHVRVAARGRDGGRRLPGDVRPRVGAARRDRRDVDLDRVAVDVVARNPGIGIGRRREAQRRGSRSRSRRARSARRRRPVDVVHDHLGARVRGVPDVVDRADDVAAGALSALAMAPFDAWPVLFVTFPILVWLVDGAAAGRLGGTAARRSPAGGSASAIIVAGLYWVGYAFLVDAKTFGWLLPFAVIALPAGMACLHRRWPGAGAPALDARTGAAARARGRAHRRRMAARPPVQRLSLEHLSATR